MRKSDLLVNVQPDLLTADDEDDGERNFTGWAKCVTHNREASADLKRRVYFCARCGVERVLEPWLVEGTAEAA